MRNRLRALILVLFVGALGFGFAGPAMAQSAGSEGGMEDCVEDVLDLPALNVCKDENGAHIMELPAIGTLREPTPEMEEDAKELPKTGMHVEDFAAIGLAAVAGGAVLLRRLRLAVS